MLVSKPCLNIVAILMGMGEAPKSLKRPDLLGMLGVYLNCTAMIEFSLVVLLFCIKTVTRAFAQEVEDLGFRPSLGFKLASNNFKGCVYPGLAHNFFGLPARYSFGTPDMKKLVMVAAPGGGGRRRKRLDVKPAVASALEGGEMASGRT